MSSQDSLNEDKVYQFISDPKHKENLSGRVRAACVTCRRKKIKCGGEVPCKTCEEKGVVCEGLTERKKPKTKADSRRTSTSTQGGHNESAISSPEIAKADSIQQIPPLNLSSRGSTATNVPRRPTIKDLNFTSNDSGYSSGQQSSPPRTGPQFESVDSTLAAYGGSTNISPTNISFHDWHFGIGQGSGNFAEGDVVNPPELLPASSSTKPIDWLEQPNQNVTWWPENNSGATDPTNLISTARLLEEQAQSLRRLASQQHVTTTDDRRRQTVTLPITNSFNDAAIYPSEAFDDLTLLLTERTQDSNLIAVAPELSTWIGVNPDYSSTLNFHQALRPQARHRPTSAMQAAEFTADGWDQTLDQSSASNEAFPAQTHHDPGRNQGSVDAGQSSHVGRYAGLQTWPRR